MGRLSRALRPPSSNPSVGRWAVSLAGCCLSYPAAALLTIVLAGTVEGNSEATAAGTLGHGIVLAVDTAVWAALTALAVFGLAVLLLTRRPRLSPMTLGLFALLTLMAAGVQLGQHEWARSRFGVYDPEYVGFVAALPPALILAAATSVAAGIAIPLAWKGRRGDI